MKKILSIALMVLILGSICYQASGNNDFNEGNISSLYLKVFDSASCKVTLNGMKLKQMDDLYTINGLKPGQYLLRIALLTNSKSDAKEKVIYHNYINIAAKKVIFAYIDKKHNLQIVSQRTTTTVQAPEQKMEDSTPIPSILMESPPAVAILPA